MTYEVLALLLNPILLRNQAVRNEKGIWMSAGGLRNRARCAHGETPLCHCLSREGSKWL